jgi:hypothetical protein
LAAGNIVISKITLLIIFAACICIYVFYVLCSMFYVY